MDVPLGRVLFSSSVSHHLRCTLLSKTDFPILHILVIAFIAKPFTSSKLCHIFATLWILIHGMTFPHRSPVMRVSLLLLLLLIQIFVRQELCILIKVILLILGQDSGIGVAKGSRLRQCTWLAHVYSTLFSLQPIYRVTHYRDHDPMDGCVVVTQQLLYWMPCRQRKRSSVQWQQPTAR